MTDPRDAAAHKFDEPTINTVEGAGSTPLRQRILRVPTIHILYVGKAVNLKERLKRRLENPPIAGISHFFAE
jgi:hypothetical protein